MEEIMPYLNMITGHLAATSLYVTVLIALVLVIDAVNGNAPSRFRYLLWCMALVPLVIPVRIPFIRTAVPSAVIDTARVYLVPAAAHAFPSGAGTIGLMGKLSVLWLASGAVICGIVMGKVAVMFMSLRHAVPIQRQDIQALVSSCRMRMGTAVSVETLVIPDEIIDIPCVTGVFRRRLLLPQSMVQSWSCADLEPVIFHELAHITRNDFVVNFVQIAVQVVYFFNPLVWLVNRRIRRYREEACDDIVLYLMAGNKSLYAHTIIRVIESARNQAALGVIGMDFVKPSPSLSERIQRIMRHSVCTEKPLTVRHMLLLAAVFTFGLTLSCAPGLTRIDDAGSATEMTLGQNYPNPVNDKTTIPFALKESGAVSLVIYDVKGGKVATLIDKRLDAGSYKIEWDADVDSGIYFYELKVGDKTIVKKMTVIT